MDIIKIHDLPQGADIEDGHEVPISTGPNVGDVKRFSMAILKAWIIGFVTPLFAGITQGPAGVAGTPGAQGIQGQKGDQGVKGDKGDQGVKGDVGPAGAIGIQGPTGLKGDKGNTGSQGVQGIQGPAGADGIQGPAGTDGAIIIAGEATNLLSGTIDPTVEGIDGDFYVNTTTDILFGPKAAGVWPAVGVVLTGPTGPAGPQGIQGIQGVQGADGAQGEKGNAGDKGDQGDKGDTGATGANGLGVPNGGLAGQVLSKIDAVNGNTHWITPSDGGSGAGIKVYNVENYGAVHNGLTDDTASIQSAINAAHAAGGGIVYFPNGVYIIDGALTNGNQINIPFDEYVSSSQLTRIKLLGEIGPNMFSDPLGGGAPPATGAVLLSTLSTTGNIIGSADGSTQNFIHLELENLTVRVNSKSAGIDVAPAATAIDAGDIAYLSMLNIAVDTESNRNQTVQPLSSAAGVVLPKTNNYVFVNVDRVLVTGYYTGIEMWECSSLTNVFVDGCYYGLSLNATNHAAFASKLFISRCAIDIVVRGAIPFFIDHYGFETMAYGWNANQYNLQELTPGAWGYIKYNKVISNVGHNNDVFVRSNYDASGIKVESINYSAQTETFNTQTGDYMLAPLDREKTIIMDSEADVILTIPHVAVIPIPVGSKVKAIQNSAGKITIRPAFGVTINSYLDYNISSGKFAKIELLQKSLNTWHLSGDLNGTDGGGGSEDPAADFVSVTGITDSGQISAIDTLVTDLKTAGLWAKMSAIYPFVGTTSIQHSYNLVSISDYRLTYSGSGTHDADGYHPNGTDAFADTSFIPSAIVSRDSIHLSFYGLNDIGGSDGIYMGAYTSSIPGGIVLRPKYSDGNNYCEVNGTGSLAGIASTKGLMLLNRNSALNFTFDKDGTLVSTVSAASTPSANCSVTIGALNRDSVAGTFSAVGCGFASLGFGFTDSEKSNFNTIVQAFLTSIGR